ncbi:NUDIX hydrolase [Micrococcus luteus]|uniref:ADP-ribose pyrophosphatase YjhB (NUDIX family) n=1 Tax=Micrococcus yunnanensis TaxID=566027 RepID=A0ABR6D2L6_9MICC|nr:MULTISPECIES: NUDIX hydrolase [Micrococcus]AYO50014.1 NUDIX domain-containing protein [Micrococcus luteus]EZP53638.1 ADP-ribose pyrophosphatase [Micrococcus luteus]MBA9060365.1 ADP-ribose pyrophosphatase YjhB (NUDIX family) [Micrococcus yunnanensis]MBO1029291.1 NUDIX hydrolase [Micrococcus luteus]MBY0172088.1 NUDIX hydrolase [Micrococcus luteus]
MPVAEARVSVAVSTAVFGVRPDPHGVPRLCVALVPRMREPFLDRWALPGAWLGADEELADVAARVAAECVPGPVRRLEQLAAFGAVDRSPTGRVLTVAHWALSPALDDDGAAPASSPDPDVAGLPIGVHVRWHRADAPPALAFDHAQILAAAVARLRADLPRAGVGHALLGPSFTLAELRAVHEAVLGRGLDAANFRRATLAAGALEETGEVRGGTPHRPPKLYRYRPAGPGTDPDPAGPDARR